MTGEKMDNFAMVMSAINQTNVDNTQVLNPRFVKDADFDRSKFTEQESDVPGFETELVDQRGPGLCGDEFYGTIAYEIGGLWLLLDYVS